MTTFRDRRLEQIARGVPEQVVIPPEVKTSLDGLTRRQLKWLNFELGRLERAVAAGTLDPSRLQAEFNERAYVAGVRSDMERRGELAPEWP